MEASKKSEKQPNFAPSTNFFQKITVSLIKDPESPRVKHFLTFFTDFFQVLPLIIKMMWFSGRSPTDLPPAQQTNYTTLSIEKTPLPKLRSSQKFHLVSVTPLHHAILLNSLSEEYIHHFETPKYRKPSRHSKCETKKKTAKNLSSPRNHKLKKETRVERRWHWFTNKNDTILNYYYFQMTKHDVTNTLPASQTHDETLKRGKSDGKSCWTQDEEARREKKLRKVCSFLQFRFYFFCPLKLKVFFVAKTNSGVSFPPSLSNAMKMLKVWWLNLQSKAMSS